MTTTRPQSRTLGDLLDELAAATPQAPALVSGTERLDFAALKARTDGFARALLGLGIGRGDRVALLCSNRSEWVVAACAAAKLGAPVAAISTFSSAARARLCAGAFRRPGAGHAEPVPRPPLPAGAGRAVPGAGTLPARGLAERGAAGLADRRRSGRRCVARHLRPGGVSGARRRRRWRGAGAGAGRGHAGRHLLHPLHLGLHRRAQGRDAGARAIAGQRLRHRRAAAPDGRGPAVAGGAAVLGVRLGQRDAGDHDPRRLHGAAGGVRAGRGAGLDRARALQRVLRHGQHGARPAGASGSSRAPAGCDAHRAHHRSAGGHHAHHPGAGRRRALHRLRLDRDLRQLRRHRRARPAAAAPRHARPAAAGHDHPRRRSGDPGAAAAGRDRRAGGARLHHARLLPRAGARRPGVRQTAGSSPAISARSSRMAACASAAG